MKKELLAVALLMGTWAASAQVGIGTLNPDKSAQLDITASDKGILIPRVSLTSITDATTISKGNVESLLVYNKTNNDVLKAGYYYWYDGEWRKLITPLDQVANILTVLNYDPTTNTLTYVDEDGVSHDFILNNTKNSTVVLNGTILTITDTDGAAYTVDLAGLDTNTKNTSLVLDGQNQLKLTDSDGSVVTANLSSLFAVDNNTVNTFFTLDQTNNHLTLIDSEGNSKTVDLSSLFNTTKVTAGTNVTVTGNGSVATPYVVSSKNTTNNAFTLNQNNQLILKDSEGNEVIVDLSSLTKNTTIVTIDYDPVTNNITVTDSDNNTSTVDISGVLKAKNGLHVSTDKHVVLGGDLIEDTTISTAGKSLAIKELPQTNTTANRKVMIVNDVTGKLEVADAGQIISENTTVDVNSIDNTYSVTVNGKTDAAPIVNSNELSIANEELISKVNNVEARVNLKDIVGTVQKTTTIVDGTNTTVSSTVSGNATEYKVNVATANAGTLGVVKQAAVNPTVFINASGELSTTASAGNNIIEVSQDYIIADEDVVVFGNAGADITITLPNPSGTKGRKLTIKKSDTSNNTYVNVVSAGGATIENEPDLYTSLPFTGWDLMSDGNSWKIVNKF